MNHILEMLIAIGITVCILAVSIGVKCLCRKYINQNNSNKQQENSKCL